MTAQYALVQDAGSATKLFVAPNSRSTNPVWTYGQPCLFGSFELAEQFRQQMAAQGVTEEIRAAGRKASAVPIGYVIATDQIGNRCLMGGPSPAWTNALEHRLVFDTREEALDYRNRTPIASQGFILTIIRV